MILWKAQFMLIFYWFNSKIFISVRAFCLASRIKITFSRFNSENMKLNISLKKFAESTGSHTKAMKNVFI